MNWLQKTSQELLNSSETINYPDYPIAGNMVSGLQVLEQVDNMSSISASFRQHEILDNIREVPMSDFGSSKPADNFYARNDMERCRLLANHIIESREIMPLIVAIEDKGSYILEGGHRFVALGLLAVPTFPALIVIDKD